MNAEIVVSPSRKYKRKRSPDKIGESQQAPGIFDTCFLTNSSIALCPVDEAVKRTTVHLDTLEVESRERVAYIFELSNNHSFIVQEIYHLFCHEVSQIYNECVFRDYIKDCDVCATIGIPFDVLLDTQFSLTKIPQLAQRIWLVLCKIRVKPFIFLILFIYYERIVKFHKNCGSLAMFLSYPFYIVLLFHFVVKLHTDYILGYSYYIKLFTKTGMHCERELLAEMEFQIFYWLGRNLAIKARHVNDMVRRLAVLR
jgi:hypothetical protein